MGYNKYFRGEVAPVLAKLNADTKPEWGSMNAEEMVEHLIAGVSISMEDAPRKITTPEDKLEVFKKFLMSDRPFGKDLPRPKEFDDYPTKNGDINGKKVELLKRIEEMLQYFEKHPYHSAIHSSFGRLNVEEWKHLHKKHFTHHFLQFGLL
ncbi:DUF1569 domain-containing protein [Owenweeksia hongkongensis]|uniref:DUF1569 domain-containing protein n=1 Tax=Owenweeksia hongkongensis TaxID=253245 RepID=UPI003A90908D